MSDMKSLVVHMFGGKTTAAAAHPDKFLDVDELVDPHHPDLEEVRQRAVATQDWSEFAPIYFALLTAAVNRLADSDKDKIILLHSWEAGTHIGTVLGAVVVEDAEFEARLARPRYSSSKNAIAVASDETQAQARRNRDSVARSAEEHNLRVFKTIEEFLEHHAAHVSIETQTNPADEERVAEATPDAVVHDGESPRFFVAASDSQEPGERQLVLYGTGTPRTMAVVKFMRNECPEAIKVWFLDHEDVVEQLAYANTPIEEPFNPETHRWALTAALDGMRAAGIRPDYHGLSDSGATADAPALQPDATPAPTVSPAVEFYATRGAMGRVVGRPGERDMVATVQLESGMCAVRLHAHEATFMGTATMSAMEAAWGRLSPQPINDPETAKRARQLMVRVLEAVRPLIAAMGDGDDQSSSGEKEDKDSE